MNKFLNNILHKQHCYFINLPLLKMLLSEFKSKIELLFSSKHAVQQYIHDLEYFYETLEKKSKPIFLIQPIIIKYLQKKTTFKIKKSWYSSFIEIANKNKKNLILSSPVTNEEENLNGIQERKLNKIKMSRNMTQKYYTSLNQRRGTKINHSKVCFLNL